MYPMHSSVKVLFTKLNPSVWSHFNRKGLAFYLLLLRIINFILRILKKRAADRNSRYAAQLFGNLHQWMDQISFICMKLSYKVLSNTFSEYLFLLGLRCEDNQLDLYSLNITLAVLFQNVFSVFLFGYITTMTNIYRIFFKGRRIMYHYELLLKPKARLSHYWGKKLTNKACQQQTQLQFFSLFKYHQQQSYGGSLNKNILEQKQGQIFKQEDDHNKLGDMMMRCGNYDEAINQFSKASKMNKNNSKYPIKIALCLMRSSNYADAIKLLQRQSLLKPEDQTIYHYLGAFNFHIQNYKDSILHFYKCSQINKGISLAIVEKGKELFKKGQYNDALIFFLKAFIHSPHDKQIVMGLKDCFIYGQKVEQGKQIYSILAQLHVDKYALDYSLGLFNFEIGNIKESKPYLLASIKSKQDDGLLNTYLGTICLQENELNEAKTYYQKTLIQHPNNIAVLNSLGLICMKQKQFSRSRQYYMKCLSLHSNDSMALSGLGYLCFEEGKMSLGIQYLEKAVQVDQLNYPALQKLGTVYQLLGDEGKAKIFLQKAQKVRRYIQES